MIQGSARKIVHVLFVKCPAFLGLIQTDYMKLFYNDPIGYILGEKGWKKVQIKKKLSKQQ